MCIECNRKHKPPPICQLSYQTWAKQVFGRWRLNMREITTTFQFVFQDTVILARPILAADLYLLLRKQWWAAFTNHGSFSGEGIPTMLLESDVQDLDPGQVSSELGWCMTWRGTCTWWRSHAPATRVLHDGGGHAFGRCDQGCLQLFL